ncbi:MAG: diguanylate cyclase [Clostridium sp.]
MYDNKLLKLYMVEFAFIVLAVLIIYIILSQKFFKRKMSCIEELESRVRLDQLTGLYNKTTTRSNISDYLKTSGNSIHALFVIDIDDFKVVNDRYGHLIGDNLLKNIASNIREIFREDDIVGRFGGDEFVVFMRNIPSNDIVVNKASRMCNILSKNFIGSYGSVSASVGIAMYPKDGQDYYSLFEHADKAMYSAKRQGKNCYCIYEEKIDKTEGEVSSIRCKKPKNYISSVTYITSHIFKTLYHTREMDKALKSILEYVGVEFNVDRTYIYELNDEENKLTNTYEWCRNVEDYNREFLRVIEWDNVYKYGDLFDSNGMYYCNSITQLPEDVNKSCIEFGLESFVHSRIVENDRFKGFVGFDCFNDNNRIWTSDEVEALKVISDIIGDFMFRKRAESQIKRERDITRVLVDSSDACTYVIDRETHKILFISKKLQELTGANVGDSCYKIISDDLAACTECPLYNFEEDQERVTIEMESEVYGGHVLVTLCNLTWIDGSSAYAVNIKEKN